MTISYRCIYDRDKDLHIKEKCKETAIAEYENRIFGTYEEAEIRCNELNGGGKIMSDLFNQEAKIYRPTKRIKSAKYQKGMEDGYILRLYKDNCTILSGAIICTSLEQAEEESKKLTREKMCLCADHQHIPVIYDKPVPIMITHKYTDEEHKELSDADLLPFNLFFDDNEDEYDFAEITEENFWIIKNLIDGRYFTASTEFMQEYELLED